MDARHAPGFGFGVAAGVPTFVAGGHGVVGTQPYAALEQLVRETRGKV